MRWLIFATMPAPQLATWAAFGEVEAPSRYEAQRAAAAGKWSKRYGTDAQPIPEPAQPEALATYWPIQMVDLDGGPR